MLLVWWWFFHTSFVRTLYPPRPGPPRPAPPDGRGLDLAFHVPGTYLVYTSYEVIAVWSIGMGRMTAVCLVCWWHRANINAERAIEAWHRWVESVFCVCNVLCVCLRSRRVWYVRTYDDIHSTFRLDLYNNPFGPSEGKIDHKKMTIAVAAVSQSVCLRRISLGALSYIGCRRIIFILGWVPCRPFPTYCM